MSSAGNGRTVTSLMDGGEDGNGIFPPIVALPILDLTSDLLDTLRSINAHLATIAENTNATTSKGGK